ncbi:hypothetical protein QZH46_08735 [Pseudomonas corrugata]
MNDGSHYAPDELYVAISDTMAASYLKIFFKIFKAAKHDAHYKMMMGDAYVDLDPDEPAELQAEATTAGDEAIVAGDASAAELPIVVPVPAPLPACSAVVAPTIVPIAAKPDTDQLGIDQDIPF